MCQGSITDWGTITKILEVIYVIKKKKKRKTNKNQNKSELSFPGEAMNRAVCFRQEAIYKLN